MATYNAYPGADGALIVDGNGSNAAGAPAVTVLDGTFDASLLNLAANDVVEVIKVPKGTLVLNVMYEVINGDATQTVNIGDGADVDGWVAAASVATAGATGLGAGALASAGGKFYSADDTIDIECPTAKAHDTMKIRVFTHAVMCGVAG